MPSIVNAAEPVVGHGNEGELPGRCRESDRLVWNTGGGIGRDHS